MPSTAPRKWSLHKKIIVFGIVLLLLAPGITWITDSTPNHTTGVDESGKLDHTQTPTSIVYTVRLQTDRTVHVTYQCMNPGYRYGPYTIECYSDNILPTGTAVTVDTTSKGISTLTTSSWGWQEITAGVEIVGVIAIIVTAVVVDKLLRRTATSRFQ